MGISQTIFRQALTMRAWSVFFVIWVAELSLYAWVMIMMDRNKVKISGIRWKENIANLFFIPVAEWFSSWILPSHYNEEL